MLKLDSEYFSKSFVYGVWQLMAFQAGYINVGGFFIAGTFVSHVTGTSSNVGMGIANMDLAVLATFCTVLLSFIIGAAFAGHFVGRKEEEKKEPNYVLVLAVKAFFFGSIFVLSELNHGGLLGLDPEHVNLVIIFLLSFCCGTQNSTCSQATNGFLKPTHMTGLSTDVGINLTRIYGYKKTDPNRFKEDLKKNLTRINILLSFISGGIIATFIFSANAHHGFLFPFLSSLTLLGMGVLRDVKKIKSNSLAFKGMKGGLVLTAIATVFIGINSLVTV